MFFSKQEEKIIGNLFKDISEEPHKIYILEFNDGSILEVKQDTCYESDNDLDEAKKFLRPRKIYLGDA